MNFGICCSNILPVVTPLPDNTEDPTTENTQVNDLINNYKNHFIIDHRCLSKFIFL